MCTLLSILELMAYAYGSASELQDTLVIDNKNYD